MDDRQLAKQLFNRTWELIETPDRDVADDDRMVHMAHASCHHWQLVGTAANLVRGEWLCSRVYAVLGRVEPALHHAQRARQLCVDNQIRDWDLAFAHEALARAQALAGNATAARQEAETALAVPIAEQDDRNQLRIDLATVPGLEHL